MGFLSWHQAGVRTPAAVTRTTPKPRAIWRTPRTLARGIGRRASSVGPTASRWRRRRRGPGRPERRRRRPWRRRPRPPGRVVATERRAVAGGDLVADVGDRSDRPGGQHRPQADGQSAPVPPPATMIAAAAARCRSPQHSSGARRRPRRARRTRARRRTAGRRQRTGDQTQPAAPRRSRPRRRARGARRRRSGRPAVYGAACAAGGDRPAPASGGCERGTPGTWPRRCHAGPGEPDEQPQQHRFERQTPSAVLAGDRNGSPRRAFAARRWPPRPPARRSPAHPRCDASERAPASERPATACVAGERHDGHA